MGRFIRAEVIKIIRRQVRELIRGDTGKFKFQRLDSEGSPITTQADELYFTVKVNSRNKQFVFQKTLEDMTFDEDGTYHFTIEPTDTDDLNFGTYVYDIEVKQAGVVSTIAMGDFILLDEVTYAENEVQNG
jgi:hypothetical protein